MLRRGGAALNVAVLAAVMAAGCSTSSTSSSSGPTASGGSSGLASGGGSWTIGGIASCSGSQASSLGGVCPTMKAWAQSVNANGGIDGHQVNLVMMDDAGNPATSVTLAHQLIEQDHVIAIVGDESLDDAAWASYAASHGVPVIGGLPILAPFLANPDFYSIGLSEVTLDYASLKFAVSRGYKKFGFLYCAESPSCAQALPLMRTSANMTGVSLVIDEISATAPNYTAPCLQMKNSGVQAYWVAEASQTALQVLDSCVAQGNTAKLFEADGNFTQSFLADKNTNGAIGLELVAPWFDTKVPGIAQYHQAMQKYAPQVYNSAQFGPNTTYAWASGMLFEAAAKAAHVGSNPTSADVKRGLYALKGETLNGLVAPLTYTPGKPSLPACYFPIQIQDGRYSALDGAAPQCIPSSTLALLFKGFGI